MDRLYGLIGRRLGHSFSEKWFADEFSRRGLNGYSYRNFQLEDISMLPRLLREHPQLLGFNVTVPFKEAIIPYLDRLDSVVEDVGAVNCVKIEDGCLTGYNTDVYGFEVGLAGFIGRENHQTIILGTGGAAKAAAYVLEERGSDYIMVSRNPVGEHIGYEELTPQIITGHRLIVNATPLGMYPDTGTYPDIPYDALTPEHYLYDMVYNPVETIFLAKGKEQGVHTANGQVMLEAQAARSLGIWMSEDNS